MEYGGLLLGTTQPNHIAITGFLPFSPSQQDRTGGRFVVQDEDRERFRDAIWNCERSDNPVTVVGYYRGHLGDGLHLRAEDLSLIERFFAQVGRVFLAVRPDGAAGSPLADFFFRDGDFVFPESILPFPFEGEMLEREAAAAQQRNLEESGLGGEAGDQALSTEAQLSALSVAAASLPAAPIPTSLVVTAPTATAPAASTSAASTSATVVSASTAPASAPAAVTTSSTVAASAAPSASRKKAPLQTPLMVLMVAALLGLAMCWTMVRQTGDVTPPLTGPAIMEPNTFSSK